MSFLGRIGGAATYALKGLGNWCQKDPEKAIAYMTVGSIVVKDGIGCYKYTTQSLHNDKIPEDKRPFVSALDLTNGILFIIAQIALFFLMRKYSEPLFNKLFKGIFGTEAMDNGITRIRMIQKQTVGNADRKLTLRKEYEKARKEALDVFKFVAELAAATIVGKRIIVPLIATPLASKVQSKMEKHITKHNNNSASTTQNDTQEAQIGQKLDVTSSTEQVNLKERYKKYYGAIKND